MIRLFRRVPSSIASSVLEPSSHNVHVHVELFAQFCHVGVPRVALLRKDPHESFALMRRRLPRRVTLLLPSLRFGLGSPSFDEVDLTSIPSFLLEP